MATDADSPDPAPPNDPLLNPWDQPQDEPEEEGTAHATDWNGTGDLIDASVQGTMLAGDLLSAGALDAAAEGAGAAIEGAGAAIEAVGGVAEGCVGCSLAVLITLFAAAGSAMAFFR